MLVKERGQYSPQIQWRHHLSDLTFLKHLNTALIVYAQTEHIRLRYGKPIIISEVYDIFMCAGLLLIMMLHLLAIKMFVTCPSNSNQTCRYEIEKTGTWLFVVNLIFRMMLILFSYACEQNFFLYFCLLCSWALSYLLSYIKSYNRKKYCYVTWRCLFHLWYGS